MLCLLVVGARGVVKDLNKKSRRLCELATAILSSEMLEDSCDATNLTPGTILLVGEVLVAFRTLQGNVSH